MNTFMNALQDATNYTYTENGAVTHTTTNSDLLDMFAMGAAMRSRSDEDVIFMFKKAYTENPEYALKCLFYIRDILEGQGERRFFRVCLHWLATVDKAAARRMIKFVPEFGRWDDLYTFVDTPVEEDALAFIRHQLVLDVNSTTPSLLAKWMKSENTSSSESKRLARITRHYLKMTSRQYRKTLSILRKRINVLERLMSAGEWDKIEFDKIPSRAGIIYRNAFARHDVERMKLATTDSVVSYEDFAKDKETKVNAKALYPYDVVLKARNCRRRGLEDTERLMVNKYWDNLTDYFKDKTFNGIAVVDTSGSMTGWDDNKVAPIDVAISLGLYCAEHNHGPFANRYISFASRPQLINTNGVDFVDKVDRIYRTNLMDNTNIEAVFDLILATALSQKVRPEDIPQNVIIISDMEFDAARGVRSWYSYRHDDETPTETLMESIANEWAHHGMIMPNLVFWNVDARQDNIPMKVKNGITFVSGCSPTVFDMIMTGKTGYDLMMDKLNSKRYAEIK